MESLLSRETALQIAMWKGAVTRDGFKHRCPYRSDGVTELECVELSGASLQQNLRGCCGTQRGPVGFDPCNSRARRCRICLEQGLRGSQANPVANVMKGTCKEHSRDPNFRVIPLPRRSPHSIRATAPEQSQPPGSTPAPIQEPDTEARAKPEPAKRVLADPHEALIEAALKKAPALTPRFRKILEHADKSGAVLAALFHKEVKSISVDFSGLYKHLGLSDLPNRSKREVLLAIRSRLQESAEKETESALEAAPKFIGSHRKP